MFTPGGSLRLNNAHCVKIDDRLKTYSVAALGHWAMDGISGVIIRG